MREESDFLDIFQDPVMTVIAMVLLSTLWMLIPSQQGTADEPVSPGAWQQILDTVQVRDAIEATEAEIASLDSSIGRLQTAGAL